MKPHLVVIDGGRKPKFDPQRADEWNRDWSPGQHAGTTFTTGSAHVDEINARPRRGLKVFVGGSRTITDRAAIEFARTFYEAVSDEMPLDLSLIHI